MIYDVVVANGTVIDGSKAPGYRADVGVSGDSILHVGDLTGQEAGSRIDASGRVVAIGPPAAERALIVPGSESTEGTAASSAPVAPGSRVQRLAWAQLLARVFAVDITLCSRCGGRMQCVASGESRRDSSSLPLTDPDSVRTYLTGVGLPAEPPLIAPARPPPPELEFAV